MSYQMSITVIGADEIRKAIANVNGIAKKAIGDALNKTAYMAQAKAVSHAPHKTGTLWNSIHVDSPPGNLAQAEGNMMVARVGTNLVYARAQEYGTVGMTINSHRGNKAFTYIGNIKPKFYMKQAMDDIKTNMSDFMSEAVRVIVSQI